MDESKSDFVPEQHLSHVDLSKPRYDQTTYVGRAKHFFEVTDPRNVLATSQQLEEAKILVLAHKAGKTSPQTTEDQLWKAKKLYDSAFHPDTGEKMFLLGRMSFQVPGNMTITGCMMTFYKTPMQAIFWQWINQSFNAAVNYTNRSGDALSLKQLGVPYVLATGGAVITALSLNKATAKLPSLIGRFVPFAAVAAANCINIPLMRQKELAEGITVTTRDGEVLGTSKKAAKNAIGMVVVSRILMALPGMVVPQIIMNTLEKKYPALKRGWVARTALTVGMVGVSLVFATPLCCALFPQQSSMKLSKLEPELQRSVSSKYPDTVQVYFNKGL
jgi:tricarboxylate carrier